MINLKDRWDGINQKAALLAAQFPGRESCYLVSIDDPSRDLKGGALVECDFKTAGKLLWIKSHEVAKPEAVEAYLAKQAANGESIRNQDKKDKRTFDLEDAMKLLVAERAAADAHEGSKKSKS
jgi:hypothetical protein